MDFIKEFLIENGYTITEYTVSEFKPFKHYGKASKGMNNMNWNEDGGHINILKDANTRTVFMGVVDSKEDIKFILHRVR